MMHARMTNPVMVVDGAMEAIQALDRSVKSAGVLAERWD